ncbi:MAG: hypothetical protein C0618_05720 [Desulfuromonas sp.]|nr:MAG: hypothetical protein C0618_05720 [Desulfuromonas sp.]
MTAKKIGGGKLARSETVTVRLDPKLRYLAELAARQQRRTLSSYIEWAIEESLNTIILKRTEDWECSLADESFELWDVDDADRFVKLAFKYPELLTHEEQVLWKLICECGHLWRGRYDENDEWSWIVRDDKLVIDRLRDSWELFKSVAMGDADKSVLPEWQKKDPNPIPF